MNLMAAFFFVSLMGRCPSVMSDSSPSSSCYAGSGEQEGGTNRTSVCGRDNECKGDTPEDDGSHHAPTVDTPGKVAEGYNNSFECGIYLAESSISNAGFGIFNESKDDTLEDGGSHHAPTVDTRGKVAEGYDNSFECGIYLAESSISNAGFGIFTTRPIAKDEKVQPYPDAPGIMVTDFEHPFGNTEDDWSHNDYIWNVGGIGAFEADEVDESVMTYGSLCNFHTVLHNLNPVTAEYDDSILNRFIHPGAGSISYHSGRYFVASRNIDAGEELFDDYGEHWLDDRGIDHIPRKKDYDEASSVLLRLTDTITSDKIKSDDDVILVSQTVAAFSKRAATVFPKTKEQFESYMNAVADTPTIEQKKHETFSNLSASQILAKLQLEDRDVNWIKNNGICLEKIRTGLSTIAGAGRGAFAQTYIDEGDIITPAPLLNIPNIKSLLTYPTTVDENGERIIENNEPNGYQLLLNYCFGHRESQLILCPQTNAILINHCSTRDEGKALCGGKAPNAKFQWASDDWDPTTNEWLEKSVEEIAELTKQGSRGLSFEVVATRKIEPGEEIFIDYGQDWEEAWLNHVNSWKPPADDDDYIPIRELVDKRDLRTIMDQETNPYPKNVELYCCASEDNFSMDKIDESGSYHCSEEDLDNLFPCDIIEAEEKNRHTVRLFNEGEQAIIENYPVASITMKMKPYSSDQHLEGAFRHFIGIGDDIFPKQWKVFL